MNNINKLENNKILNLLLEFSIPAIVGMLVSSFYNVIDRIFIGNSVGSIGIAAIAVGFPLMIMQFSFGLLIGIGATSLVSIRLGEHKKEEAEHIIGNAFIMLLIISVLTTVVGIIFIDPMLKLFGASKEVTPYAKDFLHIILLGSLFMSTGFGMNNFIRAEGNPNKAMATMIIGTVLNLLLAPLFLFVFGWGMKGAALATVIAQGVSFIWIMSHFVNKKGILRLHIKNFTLNRHIISSIIKIGMPPFVMETAGFIIIIIMNKSLEFYGGDVALSGMGAVMSIAMLMIMPIIGISQGAQPIIGYNYGAKNYKRVKEALKIAVIAATAVSTLGFIGIFSFSKLIMTLFDKNDKNFIEFGSHALKIFMVFLPIVGFQIVGANYFQAVGKAKQAIILTLSRQIIILLPAMLILPVFFKIDGILYSGPLSDFISTIITGLWIFAELKQKEKNPDYFPVPEE